MISKKHVRQSIRNNVSMKHFSLWFNKWISFMLSFVSMPWERASDHCRHTIKRGAVSRAHRGLRGPRGPCGENTETIGKLRVFTKAIKQQRILPPWSILCGQKSDPVGFKKKKKNQVDIKQKKSRPWDKKVGANSLFGKWFQKTQWGSGEVS